MTKHKNSILYIGYYVNNTVFDEIVKNGINNMSAARQNFEKSLLQEMSVADDIDILAVSYVPNSSLINIPSESNVDGLTIKHFLIKKGNLWSCVKAAWRFGLYVRNSIPNNTSVIMYAVNPVFMIPLYTLRRLKRLTITTICSEVPAFRRYHRSFATKVKQIIQTYFNNRFDKYVLLTERMKDVISIGDKPYMVMEGIASCLPESISVGQRKNIVMYAGGLHPDNNILLLIDACERSGKVDECWICGSGHQEEELKARIANSPKIKLLGRICHDDVLNLEKQAKILVNLRNKDNALTRYSFPSKLIEYLASGAQVISTRLEGIPAEYFDYIYPFDGNTPIELAGIFDEILSQSDNDYAEKACRAIDFLKKHKSARIQCRRIIDFVCQKN